MVEMSELLLDAHFHLVSSSLDLEGDIQHAECACYLFIAGYLIGLCILVNVLPRQSLL